MWRVRVTVKVFGILSEQTGWMQKVVELEDNATVEDLLEKLYEEAPGLKKAVQELSSSTGMPITILVNGRSIEYLNGLSTRLNDGDTVAIIPPAGGGFYTP